jgi:hypothetical protein
MSSASKMFLVSGKILSNRSPALDRDETKLTETIPCPAQSRTSSRPVYEVAPRIPMLILFATL